MAEQQITPDGPDGPHEAPADPDLSVEALAESMGGAYWWVDDCRWATLLPTLPDDLVELLAPPILVGAAPALPRGAHDRATGPSGE